jgi:hypothetical protein
LSDSIHRQTSDVLVSPSTIAPASISRCATGAVVSARSSLRARSPPQFGIPATAIDSLIVHGTPSSGGRSSPSPAAATRASAASASVRASA